MKTISYALLTISLTFFSTASAEDEKKDISEKEKQELIDIFGEKAEKVEKEEELKKPVKRDIELKEKEFVKKRDGEKNRIRNLTDEERNNFRKEMESRRAEIQKKMQDMTPEQKKAFMKDLMENRKKKGLRK